MSKIDLFSVMELLESGDKEAASAAIHEWLVAIGQSTQKELVAEDSDPLQMTPVSGHDLENEGDEAGEGGHVAVNTDSTTPSDANRSPEAACAVEINAEEHSGYDLESAPEVTDAPGPHFTDFDLDGLDEISPEGDSSAMLNSNEGFGTDSPPSPIAGEEGSKSEAPKAAPKAAAKSEPVADKAAPADKAEPEAKNEPAEDESEDDDDSEEEKKD